MRTTSKRSLLDKIKKLEAEAEIARRLADFEESDRGRSATYHFIAKETENFEVVMLCRVCRVSRAAYYSWRKRGDGPSNALREEALLADQIYTIWKRRRQAPARGFRNAGQHLRGTVQSGSRSRGAKTGKGNPLPKKASSARPRLLPSGPTPSSVPRTEGS